MHILSFSKCVFLFCSDLLHDGGYHERSTARSAKTKANVLVAKAIYLKLMIQFNFTASS
jgi:hypothetical protein